MEMEQSRRYKLVYEDDGSIKVVRGQILKQDEFCIYLRAENTNIELVIGKRAVVTIQPLGVKK